MLSNNTMKIVFMIIFETNLLGFKTKKMLEFYLKFRKCSSHEVGISDWNAQDSSNEQRFNPVHPANLATQNSGSFELEIFNIKFLKQTIFVQNYALIDILFISIFRTHVFANNGTPSIFLLPIFLLHKL